VLALTCALAGAFELLAATGAYAQAGDNYKTATRLGSSSRFDAPLKNAAAVQKWVARKRTQTAIATVLDIAGLAQLTPTVIDILTKASPDQLKEVDFAVGDTMVWMAFRRGGTKPDIIRNLKWGGKKPFPGFMFVIDDMVRTYTFIVPKPCANITLVSSEPSRDKAKLDAEKAEKDRIEAERIAKERAAADAARLEAERRERERLEKERLEKERLEKERLEKERIDAENREKERIAAEQLAAEKKAKWDIFVAGLFGKERRTREIDGATSGSKVLSSLCAPLFGVKVGAEYKASPNFKVAPAAGMAFNFEKGSYSSAFAEVEANYFATSGKTFVGAGLGVWDFTHSKFVAPSVLVHAGQQLWTNAQQNKLFFVGEGRLFIGGDNGVSNNYQFFGGLRFVIR
jgi:hypothetical protein